MPLRACSRSKRNLYWVLFLFIIIIIIGSYHHPWVRRNGLHCPRSFVKSIAPRNVSPVESMSSFTLSIHRSLGLPSSLFPSNLACSALCGIRTIVIYFVLLCPTNYPLLKDA